ncbi:hypothetical protein F4780DRAFT_797694 [Xylariomycetidae sp. FL0641]|nr:hypothetical protein F4780DRAFT_797694 [Xylariomycetidae sp. FL0641]
MSGLEVAGLVLGAFPLAISAVDKYRHATERLGLFYNIKLEHRKCRSELEYQQVVFKRNLNMLLLPLILDDIKVHQLLEEPNGDAWREEALAELLEERLQDSYAIYFAYIKGFQIAMNQLLKELAVDSSIIQDRLQVQKSIRHWQTYQRYKLKFSNGQAVRKKIFSELNDYNGKLEKLLESSDKEARLVQQRSQRNSIVANDDAICLFWKQATSLFKALVSVWNCHCQDHYARLLLEHRTTRDNQFEFLFTRPIVSSWELRKTKMTQAGIDPATRLMPFALPHTPAVRTPNHRTPASSLQVRNDLATKTTVTLAEDQTNQRLPVQRKIFDLCLELDGPDESYCGYVAEEDCLYHVYTVSTSRRAGVESITLERIIQGDILPRPTRRKRYMLSLVLASSFLQLVETPWLQSPLAKQDVLFFSDPDDANVFLLDQPHFNREIKKLAKGKDVDAGTTISDSLDKLGILLLELCFGRALEDQPQRKRWPAGSKDQEQAVFDIMAARDWQRDVGEEAGPEYARSVSPEEWRKEMLKKVVIPLQRCRDYLVY